MGKKNVFAMPPREALHTADDSKSGAGLDAEGIVYKGADAESTAAFLESQKNKAPKKRKSAIEVAKEIAARKNKGS